jgi:hypothetical protein
MASGKDKNKTLVVSQKVKDELTLLKVKYGVTNYEQVIVELLKKDK